MLDYMIAKMVLGFTSKLLRWPAKQDYALLDKNDRRHQCHFRVKQPLHLPVRLVILCAGLFKKPM